MKNVVNNAQWTCDILTAHRQRCNELAVEKQLNQMVRSKGTLSEMFVENTTKRWFKKQDLGSLPEDHTISIGRRSLWTCGYVNKP